MRCRKLILQWLAVGHRDSTRLTAIGTDVVSCGIEYRRWCLDPSFNRHITPAARPDSGPSPAVATPVGNRPPIDSPDHRPVNYPNPHSDSATAAADTGRNLAPCRGRVDGRMDGREAGSAATRRDGTFIEQTEMKWTSGKVHSSDNADDEPSSDRRRPT